jgi:hypothetical protein
MEDKKNKLTEGQRIKLRAKFPEEAYSQHPTKTFLTTLKAMYVTERLNDVFGIGRWNIHTEIAERTDDYVLVKGRFESLDYDVTIPDQYGGHKTSGTNTEIADGFKSAITDCQSKLASYLEVGIDVFKGKVKVNNDDPKKGDNEQEKKWLNKWSDRDKTKIIPLYYKIIEKAKTQGNTIKDLRKHYKISKEIEKEVEFDLKN